MSRKARVSAAMVNLMGGGERHAWTLDELHRGLAQRGRSSDFSSVFRAAETQQRGHIVSDCPLAAQHIFHHTKTPAREPEHPIQIIARSFGLVED